MTKKIAMTLMLVFLSGCDAQTIITTSVEAVTQYQQEVTLPAEAGIMTREDAGDYDVYLAGDGKVYFRDTEIDMEDLAEKISIEIENKSQSIVVKVDADTRSGTVMTVMSNLKISGFTDVVFTSDALSGEE